MRHSHPDPEVESYLRKAERDLATAFRMSEAGPDFADIVCFHAEQCAERSLKGFILALGEIPPRTHDLVVLQQAVRGMDKRTDDLESYLSRAYGLRRRSALPRLGGSCGNCGCEWRPQGGKDRS